MALCFVMTRDASAEQIIDGKESNEKEMKKLDPEDIESLTVIKDEKANTKYGKKGKNGVIEITTKKKNNW